MTNKSFKENFYDTWMPKIYGLGAAVVIVGALFKLNGYPFATEMLLLGLSTEALIFIFSAFEPKAKDLVEVFEKSFPKVGQQKNGQGDKVDLKKMLNDAKITSEDFKNLGAGMNNLSNSAKGLSDLSNAAVASSTYADNAKKASETLGKMNQSYANTAVALQSMVEFTKGTGDVQGKLKTAAGQYQEQLKNASVQLTALNSVYKEELNDSQTHVKAIKSFYANVDTALASVGAATKQAEEFKTVMAKLNQNVNSLNKVYGAMLSAIKTN